ncbi:MAG: copper resistance system multicopper oxidase, partial [Sulfurimonadaceae bacterium]
SDFQEQTGIYGAIVIEPKEPDPYDYDQDYVVTLSDWSDEKPDNVYRKLKLSSDYYNFKQRTVGDFWDEIQKKGFFSAWNDRAMWNEMRMTDRDISDVTGYTYTFLMNGHHPESHWKALFSAGQKVRLRFVNSSAMTFFDVCIPGLKMTVVAADGNNVQPVAVDEFRIGVAETYDVIVEPEADTAYSLFAQAIDRSGYAVGSLTYDEAVTADIPSMDPLPILGHIDMGMDMSSMDHGGMDHSNHGSANMMTMDESKGSEDHSMMEMDHSTMDHSKMDMENMDTMEHSAMNSINEKEEKTIPITPLPFKEGPHTTMKAMDPQYRLDDPGIGLRNNGRRVLTYADLKSLHSTMHDAEPDREIILHLTGNMERYMWSINGIKYADAAPLEFHYGERLRITFINDTMMNHPMHLHGMWSDLETGDNNHLPRKHTVVVQPGSKISYRVTVDAKGAWAFHCHLIYHMAGMFRKVVVV